jgi:hypothetical protein
MAAFCFGAGEGTAERNNSGVAVLMKRLVLFAPLAALRETRVTPRAVIIIVVDDDETTANGKGFWVEEIPALDFAKLGDFSGSVFKLRVQRTCSLR